MPETQMTNAIDSLAWSPAGTHVAFERAGRIFYRDLLGGTVQELVQGSLPSFTPDGLQVCFGRQGRFYRVPITGGKEEEIKISGAWFKPDAVRSAVLSPDGKCVAFEGILLEQDRKVFLQKSFGIAHLDGTGTRKPDALATAAQVLWAADSQRLACHSLDTRMGNTYIVNSEAERLGETTGRPLSFSPSGKRIAVSGAGNVIVYDIEKDERVGVIPYPEETEELQIPLNAPLWLDENSMVYEGGGVLLFAKINGSPSRILDLPGIVRRGVPTFYWSPRGDHFLVELVEGEEAVWSLGKYGENKAELIALGTRL